LQTPGISSKKRLVVIVLSSAIILGSISLIPGFIQEEDSIEDVDSINEVEVTKQQIYDDKINRAVIIDQLHDSFPNTNFQQKTEEYLKQADYQVDLFTTQDITVDFYKKLPSMNYKFIVIRTHSLESVRSDNATFLFTGEKYDINKYQIEQLSDQIHKGSPLFLDQDELINNPEALDDHRFFTVGSKLVDELMIGKFPDSIIFIGGCESVRNKDLATSLIYRGASDVVGWDRTVTAFENDMVMLKLLEKVLINNERIDDAIISINEEFTSQLKHSSQLHYIRRA